MGNSFTTKVKGKGKVMQLTSKKATLNDVLHVPDIRKGYSLSEYA